MKFDKLAIEKISLFLFKTLLVFTPKVYKKPLKLNNKETEDSMMNGKMSEQIPHKRRNADDIKAYERIFNIICH